MKATANATRVRLALPLLLAVLTGAALAQTSGGDYVVKKSVVAGGSGSNAGGDFTAAATVGQVDAGTASGGDFRVQGGFWPASGDTPPSGDVIFCDGFEDSTCAPD